MLSPPELLPFASRTAVMESSVIQTLASFGRSPILNHNLVTVLVTQYIQIYLHIYIYIYTVTGYSFKG